MEDLEALPDEVETRSPTKSRLSVGLARGGTFGTGSGGFCWISVLAARGEGGCLPRRGDFDFERAVASVYFVIASFLSLSFVAMRKSSLSSSSTVSVPDDGEDTMI